VINLQAALAAAQKDIADSTDVQTARAGVAAAETSVTNATAALATATTNDSVALDMVAQYQAAVDGAPLNTLLAANKAKIAAEGVVMATLKSEELQQNAKINDPDFTMEMTSAAAAARAALNAQTAAALDTVAPRHDLDSLKALVAHAKVVVAADSVALYVTLNKELKDENGADVRPTTTDSLPDLQKSIGSSGGIWLSQTAKDEYDSAVVWQGQALDSLTTDRTALTTIYTNISTATTALNNALVAYGTVAAKYTAAYDAYKVYSDSAASMQDVWNVIDLKLTASTNRYTAYTNFSVQLNGWIAADPTITDLQTALNKAMGVEDSTDRNAPGTKQVLAKAKTDLATAKTTLANMQDQLALEIASYTTGLPLAQNHVAWMNTQITNLQGDITNLTAILAQQKAIVAKWMDQITNALATPAS
jgi:hypothetical protein